jgi:cytochrome o ubiquinol oxidase operon protein cyoD
MTADMTSEPEHTDDADAEHDSVPGESLETGQSVGVSVRAYLLGLALAVALTVASFWATGTKLIYAPGIPVAISVLAVAQMGIHLVFFLHITTAPDNTNNVLALAFGVLMACLVVLGSLWIMTHLNHNMLPMHELMRMQR